MSKSQRTVLAMLMVAALIAVAVAAVAAAPAPAPASQPQQAATPAPTMGDWQKIKAAGKIVVGTSADYPPFEYLRQELQDGRVRHRVDAGARRSSSA